MNTTRYTSREIDENESFNWQGTERTHVARFQLKTKQNKYSTFDVVQIDENECDMELIMHNDVHEDISCDTTIGGSTLTRKNHSLSSWRETFPLNSNKRNSSKDRYNNDYKRNLIGKINTCYYVKNCQWNKVYRRGVCHTSIVIQFVGTNNYMVFNCFTMTMKLAKNMTGIKQLSPTDAVILDPNGDILERLSSQHIGACYSYEWRHDMERVFRMWDLSNFSKSETLFAWCYETVTSNKKQYALLSSTSAMLVQSMPQKKQMRRALLGLQLLLCEVNATALVEKVCPGPRAIDLFLEGTIFGRTLPVAATRAATQTDNTMKSLAAALWLDLACETSLQRLPRDVLCLIYSYNELKPFSYVFKQLLFRGNSEYRVVKRLKDVGGLRGRVHLTEYCNTYASNWAATHNQKPDVGEEETGAVTPPTALKQRRFEALAMGSRIDLGTEVGPVYRYTLQ